MNNRLFIFRLMVLVIAGFSLCSHVAAQDTIPVGEEVYFLDIPTVVSSSKRMQLITEAASSVRVITGKELKESGVANITDALRSVAGVDIRETHAGQHVIGIRGFADTGHVLVTIDGNNVFMYHANHIFLDWAPIEMEEIEKIEIIKGPGAIFYGGNAFSGVINIITKTPYDLKGVQVNSTFGNRGLKRNNIIYADVGEKLEYNITAGARGSDEWSSGESIFGSPVEQDDFEVKAFSTKVVYHLDNHSSLTFGSRFSDAENVISRVCNPKTTFFYSRYDRPDFMARLFYNRHKKSFWDDTYSVDDENVELELLRTIRRGRNITSYGGYAKRTSWEVGGLKGPTAGLTESHTVRDTSVNIENEYSVSDRLALNTGLRVEHYTHLDWLWLGRISAIYKSRSESTMRFTISSGYYIPSLFQHTNEGSVYPFAIGNSNLNEEKIASYEFAYYTPLSRNTTLNATLFFNRYRDLIDNSQSGPMQNVAGASQWGGELELYTVFSNNVSGFFNYAYQSIKRDDFRGLDVDPKHKVNLGLNGEWDKWASALTLHYVDDYEEIYLTSNPVFGRVGSGPVHVESYVTLDARLAYRFNDHYELALAGTNIFNDRHYESNAPTGDAGNWHTGDETGRRLTASLHVKLW